MLQNGFQLSHNFVTICNSSRILQEWKEFMSLKQRRKREGRGSFLFHKNDWALSVSGQDESDLITASVLQCRLIMGPEPYKHTPGKTEALPRGSLLQLSSLHRPQKSVGDELCQGPSAAGRGTANKLILPGRLFQEKEWMIYPRVGNLTS